MAKFAIALFMLLVGSVTCDTRHSVTAEVANLGVQIQIDMLDQARQDLSDAYAIAQVMFETVVQEAQTRLETDIAEWEDRIESFETKYGNTSSCISSNTDLAQTARNIFTETITCAVGVFRDVFTKYEKAINSSKSMAKKLQELTDEAKNCSFDIICLTKVWLVNFRVVVGEVSQFIADTVLLRNEFRGISSSLQACGTSSAIAVTVTDGKKAYDDIQACFENLNSTSA